VEYRRQKQHFNSDVCTVGLRLSKSPLVLHSRKSSFILSICTRRQEFDPDERGTVLWAPSAQETILSYCTDEGKRECFKIKEQQLCLCECRVSPDPSGLLIDKGMLRVGNLKSMGFSG